MGYVTKTQSEYVGEVSETISLHFESFDDFLKYEQMTYAAVDDQAVVVKIAEESPTPEKKPLKELEIGKEYRIIKELHGHGFDIGQVVQILEHAPSTFPLYKATCLNKSYFWLINTEEVEEV